MDTGRPSGQVGEPWHKVDDDDDDDGDYDDDGDGDEDDDGDRLFPGSKHCRYTRAVLSNTLCTLYDLHGLGNHRRCDSETIVSADETSPQHACEECLNPTVACLMSQRRHTI